MRSAGAVNLYSGIGYPSKGPIVIFRSRRPEWNENGREGIDAANPLQRWKKPHGGRTMSLPPTISPWPWIAGAIRKEPMLFTDSKPRALSKVLCAKMKREIG